MASGTISHTHKKDLTSAKKVCLKSTNYKLYEAVFFKTTKNMLDLGFIRGVKCKRRNEHN